jgi:acyl-CoA dehydrogenase
MVRDQTFLQALLSVIERFVKERLLPLEEEVAAQDAIPDSVVMEMKSLGLFGMTIPEQYGGLGLTMEEEAFVAFEFGQASPAFRSLIGTNNGIGSAAIVMDGTEEQKAKYLPAYASGDTIGSFCLTEPEVGSDGASVKTSAERRGDVYVLNGTKRFVTNAPIAGTFTVMARTNPLIAGARGVSAFIVDASSPGIELGLIDRKMGQQGTQTCDVIFNNVEVPAANLIGGREGQGFITAMKVLDRGRLHISAFAVGVADRLIRISLDYAMQRRQFGKPIAEHQLIQAMFADSRTEAYAARCMVLDAARRRDEGHDVNTEASCCKLFATEAVGRIADRCVQIHGGYGYISEYAVERLYRDVRLLRLYEGTSQIQQLIIARNMMRESA